MTTKQMPKPPDLIAALQTTAAQIEDAKGKNREDALFAKGLTNFGKNLDESVGILVSKGGASEGEIVAISEQLNKWAESINPLATDTWDKETVTAQLTLLNSMAPLGFLTEDEVTECERLTEVLSTVRKRGTGVPAERIANRPARVEVTLVGKDGDVKVANQAGDRSMSVANILNGVKKFVAKQGAALSDEDIAVIHTAIKEVVTNGSDEQHAAGFTVRPTE